MSDEYKIDNAKIEEISAKFDVAQRNVETLHKVYLELSSYLKQQYLAHVMRGIECYIRKYLHNNRFIVVCEPFAESDSHNRSAYSAYYASNKASILSINKFRSSFVIYYDKSLLDDGKEKELRDFIAHEIGHLLFRKLKNELGQEWQSSGATSIDEKYSSILGIFTMAEKNDFYLNLNSYVEKHTSWRELIKHFQMITQGVQD